MWEIDNNLQIITFIYSILLGVFFEVYYDIFRAIRKIRKQGILTIFIEDIIYFSSISVITFIFLIAFTNGEVRAYILIGILIGFLIIYKLFSKYILCVLEFIINLIFKALLCVFMVYKRSFCKIYEIINTFLEKCINFLKKLLKSRVKKVYTNRK